MANYNHATVKKKTASKKQLCKKVTKADDVYLTKTKIAIRKVRKDRHGNIKSDTTKYFPKTKANLSCVGKTVGRVRYGR